MLTVRLAARRIRSATRSCCCRRYSSISCLSISRWQHCAASSRFHLHVACNNSIRNTVVWRHRMWRHRRNALQTIAKTGHNIYAFWPDVLGRPHSVDNEWRSEPQGDDLFASISWSPPDAASDSIRNIQPVYMYVRQGRYHDEHLDFSLMT